MLQLLQNVSKIDDNGKRALKEGIALHLEDKTEAERAATELISKITETRKGEDGVVWTVLSKFVENKKIDAAVIHVSSLLGTDEPARIIFEFAEAAHKEMQAQRKEMLEPIEQARAETVAALSAGYAELIRGQSTITGRLEAAAKRSAQQDELLDKLQLKVSDDVINRMTDISATVNGALLVGQDLLAKKKDVNPNDILRAIKEELIKKAEASKK